MYIKLILCKTQDSTLVLAVGPALDDELTTDKEIQIADFTGNIKKKATILREINMTSDSKTLQIILESHGMTWEDLFEVTHVVDYKKVESTLNK